MSRYKKITAKIIFVLLLLAAIFYTFRESAGEILYQIGQTAPWMLAAICGLSVLYHFLEGWIICKFAWTTNREFSYWKGVECAFYCSFYRVSTLGSGAGIAGVYYLTKSGIDISNATGMYMIQYVWHKISIALFCGICFLADFPFMSKNYGGYGGALAAGYVITIAICVILALSVCSVHFHRLLLWLLEACNRKGRFTDKIVECREKFRLLEKESVRLMKEKRLIVSVIALNMIKLFLWYVIMYVVLPKGTIRVLDCVTITSLAVMLAAVIPTPAGIGAVEFMMMVLFGVVTGTAEAGTAAILYRTATFMFPFLVGIVPAVRIGKAKNYQRSGSQTEETGL